MLFVIHWTREIYKEESRRTTSDVLIRLQYFYPIYYEITLIFEITLIDNRQKI